MGQPTLPSRTIAALGKPTPDRCPSAELGWIGGAERRFELGDGTFGGTARSVVCGRQTRVISIALPSRVESILEIRRPHHTGTIGVGRHVRATPGHIRGFAHRN